MKFPVIITSLLVAIAGCATSETDIASVFHYNFSLINPPTGTLSFEDEDLRFTFTPEGDGIKILIINKGVRRAVIYWEKAAYVDKEGVSHRLAVKGAGYRNKDKPPVPVAIVPGARVVEQVTPAENIYRTLLGWKVRPMFPPLKEANIVDAWDRTDFKLILPIEMDGAPGQYEFRFRVKTR